MRGVLPKTELFFKVQNNSVAGAVSENLFPNPIVDFLFLLASVLNYVPLPQCEVSGRIQVWN